MFMSREAQPRSVPYRWVYQSPVCCFVNVFFVKYICRYISVTFAYTRCEYQYIAIWVPMALQKKLKIKYDWVGAPKQQNEGGFKFIHELCVLVVCWLLFFPRWSEFVGLFGNEEEIVWPSGITLSLIHPRRGGYNRHTHPFKHNAECFSCPWWWWWCLERVSGDITTPLSQHIILIF